MMKIVSLLVLLSLAGCSTLPRLEKNTSVLVNCKNCKTPYGSGDNVSIKIQRVLEVKK